MLSVFGDESHDERKSRVFVVAGLLGSGAEWESLGQEWKQRTGGLIFHAADCESGHGDFAKTSQAERKLLHFDLARMLAESRLTGFGCAIDIAACHRASPKPLKRFPDIPFYYCFVRTIRHLSKHASLYIPGEEVEFTFDQHRSIEHNASLLYEGITRNAADITEKIRFATRQETGIQAADLWARELMKRCDSDLHRKGSHPRAQWTTLVETGRFQGELTTEEVLKKKFKKTANRASLMEEDYEKWRRENRRVDNLSNRITHATLRYWTDD